ncbi:hypothetical protein ABWW58_09705 [Sporolactobacillus sp. STCC-11]|uniref:hypothetical protein n=1 Tax=Sporolactobacillus caesalpiniae TaxID=3230362 RepID=UPI003395AEDA
MAKGKALDKFAEMFDKSVKVLDKLFKVLDKSVETLNKSKLGGCRPQMTSNYIYAAGCA